MDDGLNTPSHDGLIGETLVSAVLDGLASLLGHDPPGDQRIWPVLRSVGSALTAGACWLIRDGQLQQRDLPAWLPATRLEIAAADPLAPGTVLTGPEALAHAPPGLGWALVLGLGGGDLAGFGSTGAAPRPDGPARVALAALARGLGNALAQPSTPLNETEERLRATLAAMPELVLEIDLDGRCTDLHCSAPRLMAAPIRNLIGRTIEDTVPPEIARLQRDAMARALEAGTADVPTYSLHNGKRERWYDTTVARRMGAGGCTGYVFRIRDATADRARDTEIAMLAEVTRAMTNGAIVLDPQGQIVWVNHAVETRRGLALADLRGRPFAALADPDSDLATLDAALTTRRPLRIDVATTGPDGAPVWIDTTLQPLARPDGTPGGFLIIQNDISDLKRHEIALQEMAADAEQSRARLYTAFESLPDGFVWFDADNRLVLCNQRYRDFFPRSREMLVPGVRLIDFLRHAIAQGEFPDAIGQEEEWLARRLTLARLPAHTTEFRLADGRIMRAYAQRIPDGGHVGLRIDITALREAEARLNDIIDAAQLGTWEFDCRTSTSTFNDLWLQMLDLPPDSDRIATRERWAKLLHADDRPTMAEMTRAMRDGTREQFEIEFRLLHANGQWVHVLSRGRVSHRDTSGAPLRVSGMGIDVSARRHTEERLRSILTASAIGTWQLDHASGLTAIDEQYAALLGYSLDEVMPWTKERFESLVHPDDLAPLHASVTALYSSGNPTAAHEFRMRHRDGRWIWILSQARVLAWFGPGQPAAESGLHIDITERKEREFALAEAKRALEGALAAQSESERRFADIAEFSSDWFWEQDAEQRFTFVSSGFERSTGYSREWLLGRRRRDINKAADIDADDKWHEMNRHIAAREPFNDFIYCLGDDADGEPIWIRVNGAPKHDASGVFLGYRGVGSNVSALIAATERAEASSRAKSHFLANMSHELRTPMTGVLGMAELLADTTLTDHQRQMIDTIRGSGEGLLTILNDILDLAKIEAGKMRIDSHPFSPAEVLRQVEALFAPRASTLGLAFEVTRTPDLEIRRQGDSARLVQILMNMVGNAIKFTRSGRVRVQATAAPEDGESLLITVEDTGIGMSAEQLARVFDEFEQAETSTARRFGGTGLGLSITRKLVALLGGRISIDSTPGLGTTVRLWLPAPRIAAPDAVVATGGDAQTDPATLAGRRVLVADDNATNRRILDSMLSGLGLQVTMATDGDGACALYQPGVHDAILLDISMPGKDGIAALRCLRDAEIIAGVPAAPALAVTANALRHQIDEYLAAGFDGHVAKPFRKETLARSLQALLAPACPAL